MKKASFYFAILNVLIISAISFGQTYSGPLTGSVDAGIVVTTDDFVSMPIGSEPPAHQSIIKDIQNPDMDPIFYNGDKEFPKNYVYVEDEAAQLQVGGEIGINFELHSFPANTMTGFDPPDPSMAVGPNHIVTSVNMNFAIWDREGNLLKIIDGVQWFSQVAPVPEVAGDPQIIYDHYEQRWFFLFMGINNGAQQASNLICYSDDENPLGTWYMYRLPTTSWGDYPHVGYDDQGIYITTNNFTYSGSGFLYVQMRIINKSELYTSNAGQLSYTDIWNISLPSSSQDVFSLQPVISYTPGNNAAYFAWNNGSTANFYALYKLTDPVTNPVLTGVNVPATTYSAPPNANQLGGNTLIANLSRMTSVPVLRGGKLYAVHAIRNTQFASYGSLKYWIADVNTNQLLEEVELGTQGYFYLFPSIAVDQDNNIAITYSRSGDTEYVGAYYSTRLSTDPPGLSQSKMMAEGLGNYNRFGGSQVQRWGDYFQAALDPTNQYNFWLFSQYAADVNTWRTWLTEIRMKPFSGIYGFLTVDEINLGNVEVGFTSDLSSTIISNYGEQDLEITGIPSAIGDFNLETNLTFPLTLSTYDSLQLDFSFSPTVAGEVMITYTISSNDPMFAGPTLTGNGYNMMPALTKTIYASSGSNNNGDILTIDETTGAGTILGSSLFDDIKSISIDPNSGIIYGLNARTADSDIVRVNAGEGDSYYLFTLDIQQLAGIAFDTTGTLYTISRSGDIYTIDLTTGSTTFIVDAVSSYAGITFNPITNELWASAQSFVPPNKDAVFTVNLTTGDTTIVGHTGLGKVTNDIVFDENLNLYGVIGSATEINDFINIDASTGVGTIVGSVGYKDILGLAYEVTGVTSVEGEEDNTVPTEFVLSQNYPNPFNPSTSIEFSVPVNSNVTLTIYNLLGQVVATLVNEEMSAGNYSIIWNGTDKNGLHVTSGIYLYKMQANGNNGKAYSQIKKMVLLK